MRFRPDIRGAFRQLRKKGLSVTRIAQLFDTNRETVYRWLRRGMHPGRESFADESRRAKPSKVTAEVENSILMLRSVLDWGTARIQQGLFCLPEFFLTSLPLPCVQGVQLSRETINNVLTVHGMNGYPHTTKHWKFFRAKAPDELWQIDIKGPYTVQGRKYWFLVCIDDFSRFLLLAIQLDHNPTTAEIGGLLGERIRQLGRRPKNILSDNGSQFKEQWEKWCKGQGVVPHWAHLNYPQDKGKVERCIRNLSQEFIYLLRTFPDWLKGRIGEYVEWFNGSRFHRGIKTVPVALYGCNVGNLT